MINEKDAKKIIQAAEASIEAQERLAKQYQEGFTDVANKMAGIASQYGADIVTIRDDDGTDTVSRLYQRRAQQIIQNYSFLNTQAQTAAAAVSGIEFSRGLIVNE